MSCMSSQSGQEFTQLVLAVHSNISLDVPIKSPSLLFLSTLSSSSTPGRSSPFNRRRSRCAFHQVSSSAIGGSDSLDRNLARRPSCKNNSADRSFFLFSLPEITNARYIPLDLLFDPRRWLSLWCSRLVLPRTTITTTDNAARA